MEPKCVFLNGADAAAGGRYRLGPYRGRGTAAAGQGASVLPHGLADRAPRAAVDQVERAAETLLIAHPGNHPSTEDLDRLPGPAPPPPLPAPPAPPPAA